MFYNFADISIPFEELVLDSTKISEYRHRLLAIEPELFISEIEEPDFVEDYDLSSIFLISLDCGKAVLLVADDVCLFFPQIFVLSDKGDYKMTDKELFEAIANIYENQPNRILTNFKYDYRTIPVGWVIEQICYYLEYLHNTYFEDDASEDERIRFINYEPIRMNYNVEPEEVLHLLQIFLSTIYNYHGEYLFTKNDLLYL